MHHTLALLSGAAVGFILGLIGGGGSILATPLLLYVVGLRDVHLAIGTGALAVSCNAFVNLSGHARSGHVRWREAVLFALAGSLGAFGGSTLGKLMNGQHLLLLFALLMLLVGALMLRPRRGETVAAPAAALHAMVIAKLLGVGFCVGALSGFFGIGGGFLIVPGLLLATGMPLLQAIGSSLFSVGCFGLATAANYAWSGLVAWAVAVEFIAGGILGGWLGLRLAIRLAAGRNALNQVFAGVIFLVALSMIYHILYGAST
jgi:uncharacterized membrane protein YfcA